MTVTDPPFADHQFTYVDAFEAEFQASATEVPRVWMEAGVVAPNGSSSTTVASTGLQHTHGVLSQVAWTLIGPGHRLMTRRLVSGHLAPSVKPNTTVGSEEIKRDYTN